MRFTIAVAFVTMLASTPAFAQAVDARAALLAAQKAMGGENLKTLVYTGAGQSSLIGQQYAVSGGWPTYEVADYTRAIDYDAWFSREDYIRRQGSFPTFGRTPMAEQRMTAIVHGAHAWDLRDNMPIPLTRPYLDGAPWGEQRGCHERQATAWYFVRKCGRMMRSYTTRMRTNSGSSLSPKGGSVSRRFPTQRMEPPFV